MKSMSRGEGIYLINVASLCERQVIAFFLPEIATLSILLVVFLINLNILRYLLDVIELFNSALLQFLMGCC